MRCACCAAAVGVEGDATRAPYGDHKGGIKGVTQTVRPLHLRVRDPPPPAPPRGYLYLRVWYYDGSRHDFPVVMIRIVHRSSQQPPAQKKVVPSAAWSEGIRGGQR
eukprot:5149780-Pyramimonas_sp.AAC.1